MKFAAALSLAVAPLALAKATYNTYPVRREAKGHNKNGAGSGTLGAIGAVGAADAAIIAAQAGLVLGSLNQVVIIWVNGGGAAATTTVNSVSTVTQTVTAGAGTTTAAGEAATTTLAGATTTVATGAGATHTVTVGGPKGLLFEPSSVAANVGDMVIFTFLSQNHTATQSAFETPCKILDGGMDSGFQANANNSVNPPPQVAMQVMVSTPLWFYCRQAGHCGKGMTFSINPTANKTQAMFQQLAIAQNGTGTGGAITGNGGTSVVSGAVSATTSVASGAATAGLTATLGGTVSTATSTAVLATGTGVVPGSGSLNTDGSCSCAVVCGAGSFPAVQAQGVGAFGGMAGALPSAMVVSPAA